jgi:D-aminopeptidase
VTRPRLRELGIAVGALPTGPNNAITDVAGVRVGHATLLRGEGPLRPGVGPVRTGVTVVLPHAGNLFREKVRGAVHTINGFGKACGFEEVRELGLIESPIALTNTLNVWTVANALVDDALKQNPEIGVSTGSFNALVGECNDGYLNDLQGRHVQPEHVAAALHQARASEDGAAVTKGCVGAGAGTSCFGWKGGIGSASRVVAARYGGWTVGALVQTNFGKPEQLVVNGDAVGQRTRPPAANPAETGREGGEGTDDVCTPGADDWRREEKGSILIVLASDAPLNSRQLHRLCVRAGAGLARTGSHHGPGSGDFVIAFSTAYRIPHWPSALTRSETVLVDEPKVLEPLFSAVVEAVEEAILNSLCAAVTTVGRDGHVRHALPLHSR